MSKGIDKIGNVIQKIITIISVLVFAVISMMNILGTTVIDTELNDLREYAHYRFDNCLLTAFLVLLFLGLVVVIDIKWGFERLNIQRLMLIATAYAVILGLVWVLATRSYPRTDQQMVQKCAAQFLQGNYISLLKGEYLYMYPHQLGMVFLCSLVYRIFGYENYQAVMVINVLLATGVLHVLYQILKQITDNKKVHNFYWLMTFGCLPLIFYSTFVYGTVAGLLFALTGLWLLMKFQRTYDIRYSLGAVVCLWLSAMAKSNYQIFIIGIVLVLLFHIIKEKKFRYLLVPFVLALTLFAPSAMKQYYAHVSGIEASEGTPSSLHIAMGLQEGNLKKGCGAAGWYNSYNKKTFKKSGYDTAKADDIARENIDARIEEFRQEPQIFIDFLKEKIATQWAEPTFQTFWMVQAFENHEQQSTWMEEVMEGDINAGLCLLMKLYAVLIWLGTLMYLIFNFRKINIWQLVLIIIVVGGFVFHIFWEGKALYIMPYFVVSLVPGVQGILKLSEVVRAKLPGAASTIGTKLRGHRQKG